MYLILRQESIYHCGTPCSSICSGQPGLSPFPLRTLSIMVKESSLSMPFPIRYIIISSLQQIAVEIVATPLMMSVCAFPSHTSVPCESPEIRTRSAKQVGFASITICMAKSVPNSGIPSAPSFVPPISSGEMPSADVSLKRLITSGESSGIVFGSIPVRS